MGTERHRGEIEDGHPVGGQEVLCDRAGPDRHIVDEEGDAAVGRSADDATLAVKVTTAPTYDGLPLLERKTSATLAWPTVIAAPATLAAA